MEKKVNGRHALLISCCWTALAVVLEASVMMAVGASRFQCLSSMVVACAVLTLVKASAASSVR